MARIVLDKCITRKEVDNNGTPYTTHIMYNYEFVDDFDEPQLGRVGNFLLKKVLHYKTTEEKDIPLVIINQPKESGYHGSPLSSSSVESTKDLSAIPSVMNWGPKIYDKDNHTFSLMVRLTVYGILNAYIHTGI